MRPYEELLIEASRTGRVLKRSDIYGSGPPVDELCEASAELVREHCSISVVDLGAGCGALQRYLPQSVDYLGIEQSETAVVMARQKGRNVIVGDATATGLGDDAFEVCTMLEVLEHIDDFEKALTEAHRICRSKLLLTVPNIAAIPTLSVHHVVPWHLLEATHFNFFTPESLRLVLQRFFAKVLVWEINPWFMPGLHMNIAAIAWKS